MNKVLLAGLAASTLAVAGCAAIGWLPGGARHSHNTSSLVDFLYPSGQVPPPPTERPQLAIPLRVGLAFLPSANAQTPGLDEAHKEELLERIKQRFASRKVVTEIVLVPDYYLAGQRGFAGLDGLKRLYGLDVVALVSFDQQSYLDQNEWSLAYMTIVGAYVVKGSRHDVATLIDLAVVDPQTRQLVIRAGGTDVRHGNTTLIDAQRETREADIAGFSAATNQMMDHFDTALNKFEADVRSGTAPVRVVSKNAAGGTGGGGAIDMLFIGLLLLALARRAASQSAGTAVPSQNGSALISAGVASWSGDKTNRQHRNRRGKNGGSQSMTAVFDKRRSLLAFWLGCATVTAGVLTHVPMFLMGRSTHYVLAGMPMGTPMVLGMFAIVAGIALAGYGLLPNGSYRTCAAVELISPPENAPLTLRHWGVAALLAVALIIDIMKPASLGFVTPGMRSEYAIGVATVAWLPFAALAGTAVGSFVWGALADLYGRRAAILLSSVMFIGTSICGAMPNFWWNVGMCFLMGAAAGGMLPVAYALLAEIMPTRHRGWSLVLIGGIGAIGGFFAASGLSALLQPTFGWRVMWLLNFPTGLLLVLLSPFLPESVRFLQQTGRDEEARAVLAKFGVTATPSAGAGGSVVGPPSQTHKPPATAVLPNLVGLTAALTTGAVAWSLVNFGVLLWLPSALVAQGQSVAAASALIAKSTLIAAPIIVVSTWLYSRWSTKGCVLVMLAVTVLGLLGITLRFSAHLALGGSVLQVALVIIGSSGVIAVLLPYASENYPVRVRGRATGWVAGCSKLGGLFAQMFGVLGLAPPIAIAAAGAGVPALLALILVSRYGRETRLRDLRDLETGHLNPPPQPRMLRGSLTELG